MGRLSDILKCYDQNDLNDLAVSDEINLHDQTTTKLTTKPPTLALSGLGRNNDVTPNDLTTQDKTCVEATRVGLGRNVVKVVSPLPYDLLPTPDSLALLEHDPLSDAGWSTVWRERIQTHLQALEDWVWREEYDLMRTANNGLPKARALAREKLVRWYLFMLEQKEAAMV